MKKRFLPFGLLPRAWGLTGKEKERQKAKYYLEGEELDRALIELTNRSEKEKKIAYAGIDLRYKHITKKEYDYLVLDLTAEDEAKKAIDKLGLDLKYKVITQKQFEKAIATLKKEPWVHTEVHMESATKGYFDVDYNEFWIQELIKQGFSGLNEDEILNNWLTFLNRNFLSEAGVADLNEEPKIKKERDDEGKVAYS